MTARANDDAPEGARSTDAPANPRSLALRHPLNAWMLVALGLSAVLTGSMWPVAIGAVAQIGWALFGPRLDSIRFHAELLTRDQRERGRLSGEQHLLRQASDADRREFLALDQVRRDIRRLVEGHDNVSLEMMSGELHKVDRLLNAFLRAAATTNAQARILADSTASGTSSHPSAVPTAERTAQQAALEAQVQAARQEMGRVGEQLRLVRDQVATMRQPEDLSASLNDLVSTVEVVEAVGRETEQVGRGILASQSIGH